VGLEEVRALMSALQRQLERGGGAMGQPPAASMEAQRLLAENRELADEVRVHTYVCVRVHTYVCVRVCACAKTCALLPAERAAASPRR
jgi:hypothetical protein